MENSRDIEVELYEEIVAYKRAAYARQSSTHLPPDTTLVSRSIISPRYKIDIAYVYFYRI